MGITFQAVAVTESTVDSWRADGHLAEQYISTAYTEDDVGPDRVWLWLDKSGIGIMEAFGFVDEAAPPGAWVLGSEQLDGTDGLIMTLTAEQVRTVALHVAGVSDADFAAMVEGNQMDNDVEYLGHFYKRLREFYRDAAERHLAAAFYTSV